MDSSGGLMSTFRRVRANKPNGEVDLEELHELITTDDEVRLAIEAIRAEDDPAERKKLKVDTLPTVTVAAHGNKSKRKDINTQVPSGYIQLDVDGLESEREAVAMRALISEVPFVVLAALSPSGLGVKAIAAIDLPSAGERLRNAKAGLIEELSDWDITLDPSTLTLNFNAYRPFDPEAYLDESWDMVEPFMSPPRLEQLVAERKEWDGEGVSPDEEAELCLAQLDHEMSRDEWIKVGMGLHAHGVNYEVFEDWSNGADNYEEGKAFSAWESFDLDQGGKVVSFGTVIAMATEASGGANPLIRQANLDALPKLEAEDEPEDEEDGEPVEIVKVTAADIIRDCHHHTQGGRYYVQDAKSKEFLALAGDDMTRYLQSLGFSTSKGDGGAMSVIDKLKIRLVREKNVHHVGVLAGRPIGLLENGNGIRHLVNRKNRRIKAAKGEWPTIRAIIDCIFGEQQDFYFFSWLHRKRKQLILMKYLQGHILVIAGPTGCGKSLLIELIIQKALGMGAKAHLFLSGQTTFNAELVSAELLKMDDDGGKTTREAREAMGSALKQIAAGSKSVSCHGKGVTAYEVNPLWAAVVGLNDDVDSMKRFPVIGEGDSDSLGDKILMLKAEKLSDLPFHGQKDKEELIEAAINHELPAFLHFIDAFETPESICTGDCRFGFDEFHHPALLKTLNQDSNERTLLSMTDLVLFSEDAGDTIRDLSAFGEKEGLRYWEGSALQWSNLMTGSHLIPHKVQSTVVGELGFGDSPTKAGQKLSDMMAISKGRVEKNHTNKGNLWRIWEARETISE